MLKEIMMVKTLIAVIGSLVFIIAGSYVYTSNLIDRKDKIEAKYGKLLYEYSNLSRIMSKKDENCKEDIVMVEKKYEQTMQIEKTMKKQIEEEKNYEILASDKPNCHFDGIGWVFTKTP